MMDRRTLLMGAAAVTALAAAQPAFAAQRLPRRSSTMRLDPEIEELQQRTFQWFVDVTDRKTGMTPDRWPTKSFCSIAAVGFALTCWPVGVERGWMTRAEARERTLITLRFFHDLPQGPEESGTAGYKGFFYHFLDMETGHRFDRNELSTVDTALLVGGMLFAARYFDGDHADEREIRAKAQAIYERIEWPWVVVRPNRISMGWHPESGFIAADWNVYNEGMLVLLMAMGSPTHPVDSGVWNEWAASYAESFTDRWGSWHLAFAPIFGHQYSHMFVDFRGIQDAWMRGQTALRGETLDYFENSRRAVYAQQKYAADNVGGWGYSAEVWGLTACDGPGDFNVVIDGREREFFSYSARGPGDRDDGTIAPTAAAASIAFAPEIVVPCVKAMKAQYGSAIYTKYGFLDSFNPTLKQSVSLPLQHGRIEPGLCWVDGDYLGIDQGPIVIMTENHRTELVWKRMHGEPNLRRGLEKAGFTGGWLDA